MLAFLNLHVQIVIYPLIKFEKSTSITIPKLLGIGSKHFGLLQIQILVYLSIKSKLGILLAIILKFFLIVAAKKELVWSTK